MQPKNSAYTCRNTETGLAVKCTLCSCAHSPGLSPLPRLSPTITAPLTPIDTMKTLPTSLTHSGYTLTQVERGPDWAIYSKRKPGYSNDHYELVRVRIAPATTFPGGNQIGEREAYPKSEAWGTDGYSCQTLEHAREKLVNGCF